jgi:RNA polymerase sigma factor (sigma-70 family)
VTAVRRGEDTAFEELYSRYRTRIWSYVSGILRDADRAEDVTQEVFISVLRRLRDTERPIAFKPWIYQIAKNACIDELRRIRRRHEVPFNQDDESDSAADELLSIAPGPDAAVESKQQLDDLRIAFRGVSEVHHRILVMRELEGLSYSEIGTRLGMSPPVVESTLFRARRRLAEEYQALITGRRCERTRAVIDAWESRTLRRLGVRETRQLARHLAHCRPCRRHAMLSQNAVAIPPHALGMRQRATVMPQPVPAVTQPAPAVPQHAPALPQTVAATKRSARAMRESASPPQNPPGVAPQPHADSSPIPLASRRRPAAKAATLATPGSDSLAVA